MRKGLTTVLALLMISNIFVAYAIVPAIIAGAVLIGSGICIGLWLGRNIWVKPADERIEELEQQLTQEELENLATLESAALNEWGKSRVIVYELGDAVHYGRNYAWALAKYEILKALEQGDTLDAAASKARFAVFKYYLNVTKNIIEEANNTAEYLSFALNKYAKDSMGVGSIDILWVGFSVYFSDCGKRVKSVCRVGKNTSYKYNFANDYRFDLVWSEPYLKTQKVNLNILGKTFTVLKITPNVKLVNRCGPIRGLTTYEISFKDPRGHVTVVYNWGVYQQVLSQINNEYKTIIDNINAYVQGLKNSQFNTTDLIDPYVLATFLDKDWNTTGYYGYAAAELALLGLNTTGLDKTVTINLNGKNISGFLLTDWTGTLEVGRNYTIDGNHIWYLVTTDENGQTLLVPLHAGTTFTVVGLKDWQGNPINSTNLTNYNPHSGEIEKIYEELKRIEELYEEYINNLQTVAGGSSFNFSEWWNSLDTTAQLGLIAIGCVAAYTILRKK